VQAFDGNLEDYREWLLKRNVLPSVQKKPVQSPVKAKPANRKPPEARIKRLEELMARLNARKSEIETRLGDPAVYQDAQALKGLLLDQAYVAKELEQVESEWLELAK
jgi:ATP-binding cassette subfamily F protein 3